MIYFAILSFVSSLVFIIKFVKAQDGDTGKKFLNISAISGAICFILLIAVYTLSIRLVYFDSVNDKIDIYETENEKIEALIENTVKQYQENLVLQASQKARISEDISQATQEDKENNVEESINSTIGNSFWNNIGNENFTTSSSVTNSETSTDYLALIFSYPELKNDTFIQSEMTIYAKNKEIILDLKSEYTGRKIPSWLLFFVS